MARLTRLAFILVVLVVTGAVTAAAIHAAGGRITHIATPIGGSPSADGPSDNPVWSQDGRDPRLFAFDSAATNLTPNDNNGTRDVFVLKRTPGQGNLGGDLARASVNSGGAPGNGPSIKPALDGQGDKIRPHCVVFESTATNLDPRDKTGDSDIFLRNLKTNKTTLVSAGNFDDAHNARVDGECDFVVFEDAGKIWGRDLRLKIKEKKGKVGQVVFIAQGTNPDIETDGKGAVYERNEQIYYQGFRFEFRRGFVKLGRQKLVSSTPSGGPGNGISSNPDLDDLGRYVAFESTASDLCGDCAGVHGDRNGNMSDVFRRTLSREAPTKDRMEMVSYSQGCSASSPSSRTVDEQGNGPSHNPAMTGAGEGIVFDSQADNLKESTGIRQADPNGHARDVYWWNFPRGRKCGNVSRESRSSGDRSGGQPLNGDSYSPALTQRANYIGFVSDETGEFDESNGSTIPDVFERYLGPQ
jgi:hypothetical protein